MSSRLILYFAERASRSHFHYPVGAGVFVGSIVLVTGVTQVVLCFIPRIVSSKYTNPEDRAPGRELTNAVSDGYLRSACRR